MHNLGAKRRQSRSNLAFKAIKFLQQNLARVTVGQLLHHGPEVCRVLKIPEQRPVRGRMIKVLKGHIKPRGCDADLSSELRGRGD